MQVFTDSLSILVMPAIVRVLPQLKQRPRSPNFPTRDQGVLALLITLFLVIDCGLDPLTDCYRQFGLLIRRTVSSGLYFSKCSAASF